MWAMEKIHTKLQDNYPLFLFIGVYTFFLQMLCTYLFLCGLKLLPVLSVKKNTHPFLKEAD